MPSDNKINDKLIDIKPTIVPYPANGTPYKNQKTDKIKVETREVILKTNPITAIIERGIVV